MTRLNQQDGGDPLINVGKWIQKWSIIQPEKCAVISDDVPCTYRELGRRINCLANFLLARGLKKGDRVAVLLHNCRQYVEAFFAVSRIGGIIVPLNWRLAVPELEFIIQDSGPRFIIFEEQFVESAAEIRKRISMDAEIACAPGERAGCKDLPEWAVDYDASLLEYPDSDPETPWTSGGEDPHMLMYTSGTTGFPKGAVLSHRKTLFNALNADIYFDLTRQDVAIIARPLFHSGGLIVELAPMLYKGGTVIVRRRFTPRLILETAEKHKVTILELPATVYHFILEECDPTAYDLSTLKCCFTGGERVPVALLKTYADKGIAVSQIYGLTEASTIFWLPIEKAVEKMGSVGRPAFHGDMKIVDERGRLVKPGDVGEIIIKGPIVMNGYWKRPDLTNEVIRKGWLRTGDLARMDEEGFVYIVDRKKDMFVSGGENVYPAEIEKVLLSHPAVLDAAVIAVPHQKWGEVGKAFIVLREGKQASPEEIRASLDDKLARYKIPQYIQFVDKLPKTASGKIKKNLLR